MGDMAARAVAGDMANTALDPGTAARLAIISQHLRIKPGVKMIGVIMRGAHIARVLRGRAETVLARQRPAHRVIIKRRQTAAQMLAQPVMMQRHPVKIGAIGAKGVEITAVLRPPADKFNAQLERALRRTQKRRLVDPQLRVEQLDRRDRRLAHTNRADLVGFDQRDRDRPADRIGQRRRRHPPSRPAADNRDRTQGLGLAHSFTATSAP